jgi:hypothetical protein
MVQVAKIRSLSLSGDTLFERPPTGEPPYNLRRRSLLRVLLVVYISDKVLSLRSYHNPIKGPNYLYFFLMLELARDFSSENIIAYLQKSL